jgi:hypothetical protein
VKDAMTAQSPGAQGAGPLSNLLDASHGSASAQELSSLHGHGDSRGQANEEQAHASGQVLLGQGQTYVGATHWAAILEDVSTAYLPIFLR